ncbi:MAG TPA: hypothetical protein VGO57_15225 [Verrucomicrobiae bacterium]
MSKLTHESVRGDAGFEISTPGKINQPLPTPETVEHRARELALINGRDQQHISESDRIQARRELAGDAVANEPVDDTGITPSGMGTPPTSHGHQVKNHLPNDDDDEVCMVQQGLDEAEHDQMVESAKTSTRSKG